MGISCCAYNCTNRFQRDSGITFHRFPLANKDLTKAWVNALRRENFVPSQHHAICSKHFTPECFLKGYVNKRKLAEDAVPSDFDFPEHLQPIIAMAARENSVVTHDDISSNDITTDQDLFWAAVKEEDFKPSNQTAYTAVSVSVEPVDCDGVLTSDNGQSGIADTLLPPIEEVNVDPPPVKTKPNQDGADHWQLESESYESDFLTSIDPLLLPGKKQEEEEGRVSLPRIAAGKEEVTEEKSNAKPFVCDICKEEFEKKSPLRRHILMHSDCKRQSTNLRRHTKTHTGDKPHVCSVCSKRFTVSSQLEYHMFSHSGEKPLSCSVCRKRFPFSSALKRHMVSHNGEKRHACSVCSKSYTQSSSLNVHMFRHTEKLHGCSVCSKRFTDSSLLKVHMLYHTEEKPHSCSVCSKRFTYSCYLKRHMLYHTEEKPHVCSVCSKRFTQSCGLQRHMRTHTREKPLSCSVCSLHFAKDTTFKRHMLLHPDQ